MSSELTVLNALVSTIQGVYTSLGFTSIAGITNTLLDFIDDAVPNRAAFLFSDTTSGKVVRRWGVDVQSLPDYETHDTTTIKLLMRICAYYELGIAGAGRTLLRTHLSTVLDALRDTDINLGGALSIMSWESGPDIQVINEPSIGKILKATLTARGEVVGGVI